MFTYPGFKEVPRVVDSADSARPPTACTVQSHTRFFFYCKNIPNTNDLHKYRKNTFEVPMARGVFACIRYHLLKPPDGAETEAVRAARHYCGGTQATF